MEVLIGPCRYQSSWDRYLIRVKYVARLPACVTITATSSGGLSRKMLRSDMSSPHSKPMATRSEPLRSPHPKQVRHLALHHRGPGPHQRGPTLYERYIRKTGQNFQTPWSRGLPQALQYPVLHPGPPQRQDTWSQKVWCHLWNPVSRMRRWNCPHTGDKDERPPKTEVSTNSCGRTWTSHQNGRCQSDSPWGQYMWRRKIHVPWVTRNLDQPPGHEPRPGIWAPHSYDELLSCDLGGLA